MDRTQLFQSLAAIGGLRRVLSRDHLDKIVVIDPWLVANRNFIQASQWLLGGALLCIALGLLTNLRGPLLGGATNILVLAMLVRLAAPAASGLVTWNDFVVLGDSHEFPNTPLPNHLSELGHDESFEFRNILAAIYALIATANTPTRNAADTALKGLTSFTRAQMGILGAEALWNMRRKPTGFFATCTGLGMLTIVLMLTTTYSDEFDRWKVLIGPFSFWTGAILYALGAPKWFRGRIMPHHGNMLMHQSKTLNDEMSVKVLLGLAASAMVSVHIWVVAAFARHVVANTGHRDYDPVVEANYPTPVPRVEHALLAFPLSVLCGLALLDNYGKSTPWWLFVLVLAVPAILGLASMIVGKSTDIVRHLSEGSNGLVLLAPELVLGDISDEAREARDGARILDQALNDHFAANPESLEHRFTSTNGH